MNIVFVGAHQDDEMEALGTLIKYHRQGGHKITFICATNGDKGFSFDPDTPHEVCARTRDAEMRAVAAELDADYICLGAPDEFLYDTPEMRLKMTDALRAAEADLIFTHWTDTYNLDHTTTSWLAYQGALLTKIASIRAEHPALERWPAIFYTDPGPGYGFEATHFVELEEDVLEGKIRLIYLHESQIKVFRQIGIEWANEIRARAQAVGSRVMVPYAEAFRPCLASRRTPLANMLP